MPRLKISASLPQLDRKRFESDFKLRVTRAIYTAIRQFLMAAVPKIPIWTGFARGALAQLEELVGRHPGFTDKTVNKVLTTLPKRRGLYYKGIERTNLSSRPLGTPKADIVTGGRITKASKNGRIVFFFQIDIDYFTSLDEAKWHSFQAGREAFLESIKNYLQKNRDVLGNYLIRKES